MTEARGPRPGTPGFRRLAILGESAPGSGRRLNGQALFRLQEAHAEGWSHDELAELYNDLKLQIEQACRGWRADRVKCSDGSHGFVGALGPVLVILPDRAIYLGQLGVTAADGLLFYTGLVLLPDSTVAFPPPNPAAAGTRRLC